MPSRRARALPYIAVEGAKGAGKTSALRFVREALRASGIRAACLDPTEQGCPLHPLELLHRSVGSRVDRLTERLYAYRSNRQARLAQVYRVTCDVVLGDRSFVTTLATRWERTTEIGERAHFDRCRSLEWLIPIPDHVIYIDAPTAELRRRVELRGRRYGIRDESVTRLQEVRCAYEAIRRSSLPELAPITWHFVANDGPPDGVGPEVLRIVLSTLGLEKL